MGSPFPFDDWTKPGRDAFEFWISFFPTAPLFGVEWRFGKMMGPAANPFMPTAVNPFLVPMPGTRAAAAASKPGELDTPATADERQAQTVVKAAEAASDAARDATRIAAETGKAAARTAEKTVTRGAEAAVRTSGAMAQPAFDLSAKQREERARSAETAPKPPAARDGNAAEAAEEIAEEKATARAATPSPATTAIDTVASSEVTEPAASPDAVEHAIAAAPKPKVLLSKRPAKIDDLKQLKGIGQGLERQLNELGVWQLDQIARMTDADLAWIDAHLTNFKGRCFRDDWIGQARARLGQ